jgi:hypothetical protein
MKVKFTKRQAINTRLESSAMLYILSNNVYHTAWLEVL